MKTQKENATAMQHASASLKPLRPSCWTSPSCLCGRLPAYLSTVTTLTLSLTLTPLVSAVVLDLNYNNYTRISGSGDWNTNDQLRFNDVAAGIDAIVTIDSMTGGATISENNIDRLGDPEAGFEENWQPFITGTPEDNPLVTFTIQFVQADTLNLTVLDEFNWSAFDIDGAGSGTTREVIRLSNLTGAGTGDNQFELFTNTNLTATDLGGNIWEFKPGSPNDDPPYEVYDGIFADVAEAAVTAHYSNVSSFTLSMGFIGGSDDQITRQFSEGTIAVIDPEREIPEPTTPLLTALAGLTLLFRRKRD